MTARRHVRRSARSARSCSASCGGARRRVRARRAAHAGGRRRAPRVVAAIVAGVGVAVLVVRTRGRSCSCGVWRRRTCCSSARSCFSARRRSWCRGRERGSRLGRRPGGGGPVVVVVLDEFPAATIMRADGSLKRSAIPESPSSPPRARGPHASSVQLTHRAVPMALTGAVGDEDDLPTYQDIPATCSPCSVRRCRCGATSRSLICARVSGVRTGRSGRGCASRSAGSRGGGS